MIIQAKINWADNTAELSQNLKSGIDQIESMKSSADRLANSLGGDGLFKQANNLVAAISQLGDTTKLTDAEQEKASATLDKAIEKYAAMGKTAPSAMISLRDAMKGASDQTSGWLPLLESLGSSWVVRVAEGQLLRDAVREILSSMKDMAEFFPELALKGSVVGDVQQSFERLTAQANLTSDALLTTLRNATHGTVDDFTLMQRTNKDLAAGLNLTDAQFGMMADGARALAKATGTDVTAALDTMSDAMVTGRAKAIALLTGKIDLKAAEEDFAETLGGTSKELTAEGKLEADRVAILAGVQAGLARVGQQTDSLKDKVDQGKVAWSNFEDELGKSIATSAVLQVGMDGIKAALAQAFGDNQQAIIRSLTEKIDSALISVVGFAQAGVTGGGFLVTEYYAVNKVFGDLAQIVSGDALAFEYLALGVAKMGSATSSSAAAQQRYADDIVRIQGNISSLLDTMAARGRALQADDAAQSGVAATTAKYTATLQALIDKMKAAAQGTTDFVGPLNNEAAGHNAAGVAAEKHTEYLKQSAAEILELTKLEDAYAAAAVARSGTTNDIETANINRTYSNLIAQLISTGKYSDEISVQLAKNWGQALDSVGVDTAAIQKASTAQMETNLNNAIATLNAAMGRVDSSHIQPFRDAVDKAFNALHGLATEAAGSVPAFDAMNAAVMGLPTSLSGWNGAVSAAVSMMDALGMSADNTKIKIQTLGGQLISVKDAIDRFNGGNSVTYDLTTDEGIAQFMKMNPAASISWSTAQIEAFAQKGGTLQQLEQMGVINVYAGFKNMPGFADGVTDFAGGLAMVGENGPEMAYLPPGSNVYPNGKGPGMGMTIINNIRGTFGTMQQVTDAVSRGIFDATGVKV